MAPGQAAPLVRGPKTDDAICHLQIVKTADRDSYYPGQKVTYTIRLTNDGQEPITGAVVTDDLSGNLADAVYNGDATVGRGRLSYTAPTLTWVGDLNPGDQTAIVYSVTADNPDKGSGTLHDAVTGPSFSNCRTGTEPGCHVDLCSSPTPQSGSTPPVAPTPQTGGNPPAAPTPPTGSNPPTGSTPPAAPTPQSGSTPPGGHSHGPRPVPTGELARTGASLSPGIMIGAGALLLGGGGLVLVARRARRH